MRPAQRLVELGNFVCGEDIFNRRQTIVETRKPCILMGMSGHFPTRLVACDLGGLSATGLSRDAIGPDQKVYVTYDIDSLDPSFAPGTGTPEIGGLTTPQAMELLRALRGLNIIGADLVEVSPPYDPNGNTAHVGANLLYEILAVLPGVPYR